MIFSILMCSRNSEKTIEKAIKSVQNQTCSSWELIILDNESTDNTWEIIQQAMCEDSRIKATRLERNVGWAKGASICLQQAKGKYMTFLAADDFFVNNGSLSSVQKCIEDEEPDIVWVGFIPAVLEKNYYTMLGGFIIPPYTVYENNDRISDIYDIMNKIDYNSFFHYVNIEFLKKNFIDFYKPYYADYEGMTEAMCKADKMVMLDQLVYILTVNTSQTKGKTTWRDNLSQWRSIKKAVLQYGKYDKDKLGYIAMRIMNNNISMLKAICENGSLRDEEMNPIEKSSLERFIYIENALQKEEFTEMFYYAGREGYLKQIFEPIKYLYAKCKNDGFGETDIKEKVIWLPYLVEALCDWNGEEFIEKKNFNTDSFDRLSMAICNENNPGVFGYELLEKLIPFFTPEVQTELEKINASYVQYNLKRIYDLLNTALEIKQKCRFDEVIQIISECLEIFSNQKDYLSAEETLQIIEDIKNVAN